MFLSKPSQKLYPGQPVQSLRYRRLTNVHLVSMPSITVPNSPDLDNSHLTFYTVQIVFTGVAPRWHAQNELVLALGI